MRLSFALISLVSFGALAAEPCVKNGVLLFPAPGGVVVYGTGYAYPAWIGSAWYPAPLTYGYGAAFAWGAVTGFTIGAIAGAAWAGGAWGWGGGWGWGHNNVVINNFNQFNFNHANIYNRWTNNAVHSRIDNRVANRIDNRPGGRGGLTPGGRAELRDNARANIAQHRAGEGGTAFEQHGRDAVGGEAAQDLGQLAVDEQRAGDRLVADLGVGRHGAASHDHPQRLSRRACSVGAARGDHRGQFGALRQGPRDRRARPSRRLCHGRQDRAP